MSSSMLDFLVDAEPLTQVVFVHDYLQLVFQGRRVSLYNVVRLHRGGGTLNESDIGWVDELPRLIGQRVVGVSCEGAVGLTLTFELGTQVSVSLRPEDARGPEAFEVNGDDGFFVVEQNA